MTNDPSISLPHSKEIYKTKKEIRRNPKINTSVVAAHEQLEQKLKKLGVEIKSSYNIEPAFGRGPSQIHNHSRSKTRNT